MHDPPPVPDKYYVHEPSVKVPKNLCLFGCVFYLHGYTEDPLGKGFMLSEQQRKLIKDRIIKQGGEYELVYSARVTHVVTDSQKYPICKQALKEGKRLVNLYWIDDVLKKENKMKAPWRAWHLPKSDVHPMRIMKQQIITTTGFPPYERQYVRELCTLMGAKYTPYMTQSNTLLICKQVDSEKYTKAIDWFIPIVSGHWLVDMFFNVNDADRMPFGSGHQRHKKFDAADPFELDFMSIRQLMSPWCKAIKIDQEKLAALIRERNEQKENSSNNTNNNNNNNNSNSSNSNSQQDHNLGTDMSGSNDPSIITFASVIDKKDDECLPESQTGSVIDESSPPDAVGQENRKIPNGTESNSLSNSNDDDVFMKPAAKKPRLSTESASIIVPPPPPLQLAPNVPPPEASVKIIFTGIPAKSCEELQDIVSKLGGKVAQNHKECTHIVVSETPIRTIKYLNSLNYAKHVVSQKWLHECKRMNRFVPEQEFEFRESVEAIKRRDERPEDNRLLFKNMVFYITPGCRVPNPDVLKSLIESAGGVPVTSKGPTGKQLAGMRCQGFDFNVISCPMDLHLCRKYASLGVRILHPEFVLTSLMRQEMDLMETTFHLKPEQESKET